MDVVVLGSSRLVHFLVASVPLPRHSSVQHWALMLIAGTGACNSDFTTSASLGRASAPQLR